MTYPKQIAAVVVDEFNLTMYDLSGETITIKQGDPRIRELVAKIVPVVDRGEIYLLTVEDMEGKNHYAEVEKKSNGLVRFFKMAKQKFKEIAEKFCEPVVPQKAGTVPTPMVHEVNGQSVVIEEPAKDIPAKLPPEDQRPLTKGEAAVAEIMANAKDTTDAGFTAVVDAEQAKATGKDEEVVVAVLGDNTVVHGVEQLADQMAAVTAGITSVDGMQLFLNRAGSVTRGHSVEDLLKFVQKGELPIADDGSVLVYKRLNPSSEEGVFRDCHSGNVKQRVGSFVHMAESLVDPNRRKDCSNGLHVARRDYLTAFHGSVVVLCKLAPEDVIAVPQYDARKLRAKGYHIIARLSQRDADLVCANKPMEDTKLLANAIAGNHTPILEYVEITEQRGGGLKVTKVESPEQHAASAVRAAHSLDHLPENTQVPTEVDARSLALGLGTRDTFAAKGDPNPEPEEQLIQAPPGGMYVCEVDESCGQATPPPYPLSSDEMYTDAELAAAGEGRAVASTKPAPKLSERDQLLKAWGDASVPSAKLEAAKGIVAFKKDKKKSWTALGIPTLVWTKAQEIVQQSEAQPSTSTMEAIDKMVASDPVAALSKSADKVKVPVDKPVAKKAPVKAKGKHSVAKGARPSVSKPTQTKSAPAVKEKKMTQQEEMAKLVELYIANPDKLNARAIYAFKQKSKKSWEVLGVDDVKFQKKITERAKL